jgi:methionyl-tRNA formyltransferase
MRLAFFGSPDFAVPALEALVGIGHDVACVYTLPPRNAGRGGRLRQTAVYDAAERLELKIKTVTSLTDSDVLTSFEALELDAAVVVAFGLILPKQILKAPRLGCINIHASLLPRWRGAAPIQRSVLAGDSETGVTIISMDEGLDTGPILISEKVNINHATTSETLHESLSILGSGLVIEALDGLQSGLISNIPQPSEGITYASKLSRVEGRIDWNLSAVALERQVRAFFPWPGTWCMHENKRLKVIKAEVILLQGPPGLLLDDKLTVACGEASLRLQIVQYEGGAPLGAAAFLRGYQMPQETIFV